MLENGIEAAQLPLTRRQRYGSGPSFGSIALANWCKICRAQGVTFMKIPAFAGALLLLVTMNARAEDHGVNLVKTSIPMPDGVQLAATLYMPADLPPGQRVPVLLEYLPYRKDDDDAVSDYGHHAYFARHGYVGARVDIRGFGNSGGVQPPREYSAQEQEDGER